MKDMSEYCISVCKAQCCRRGKILISAAERTRFLVERSDHHIVERGDGQFEMHLDPCRNLKDNLCTAYDTRPHICMEFPIFHRGNSVFLSLSCPLVKQGYFDTRFPGKRLLKW